MALPWLIAGGIGLMGGLIAGLIIASDTEFREKVYELLKKYSGIIVIAIVKAIIEQSDSNLVKMGIFDENNRQIGTELLEVAKNVATSVGETYTL